MTVYIVGRSLDEEDAWEFMGVFSEESKALACVRRWEDFIGTAEMDEDRGDETVPWPGAKYPMQVAHHAGRCMPGCPCGKGKP
jgi:hypothetical protein